MTLPTFVGIGAMRCGTSWLYAQLRSHPEVFMSQPKELNFFSDEYARGLDWYERHFPAPGEATRYRAIGEITPTYLSSPHVPERLRADVPRAKLVAILRNPVDRAYSEYTKALRDRTSRTTFDAFLRNRPEALTRGDYAEQLDGFYEAFPSERILVLVYERATVDFAYTTSAIGRFLGIDEAGFDRNEMTATVNPSYSPRFPRVYASAVRARRFLVRRGLGRLAAAAQETRVSQRIRRGFRPSDTVVRFPSIDPATRRRLNERYAAGIDRLESRIGEDLSIWRGAAAP